MHLRAGCCKAKEAEEEEEHSGVVYVRRPCNHICKRGRVCIERSSNTPHLSGHLPHLRIISAVSLLMLTSLELTQPQ